MPEVLIRQLADSDSIQEITDLLHRAYRRNADMNLHFLATHQSSEVTKERLAKGLSFVAEAEGRIVGTITVNRTEGFGGFLPERPTATFNQFAVDPEYQGQEVGRHLLAVVEDAAREMGALDLCLDTAQPAQGLVAYYEYLGFLIVGEVDWRPTVNYKSWVMLKQLRP